MCNKGPRPKFTPDQVAEQIRLARGSVTGVAKRLGVTRQTVYNYIGRYPQLQVDLEDAREDMLDLVEAKLFERAVRGEPRAMIFVLRTLGRSRGYTTGIHIGKTAESMIASLEKMTNDELLAIDQYVAKRFSKMQREN